MQDELTKHGLKLYKTMADRKHSFGEKLKEILIEIGIIVFAVTLSIYFHGWSEHRHEQKEVHEFLRGLKTDLNDDIRQIEDGRKTIAKVAKNFDEASRMKQGQLPDSTLDHYFIYHEVTTHLNTARYEGFKSSGKLGNIENDSLRETILVYYQQLLPGVGDDENFGNGMQQKLLDFEIENATLPKNKFLAIGKTKAMLQLTANNLGNTVDMYDTTISQARRILKQIDKEIAR
jgi:hypothetical protein